MANEDRSAAYICRLRFGIRLIKVQTNMEDMREQNHEIVLQGRNNNGARNKEFDISASMAILVLIISPQDQSLQFISVVQMVFRKLSLIKEQRA